MKPFFSLEMTKKHIPFTSGEVTLIVVSDLKIEISSNVLMQIHCIYIIIYSHVGIYPVLLFSYN